MDFGQPSGGLRFPPAEVASGTRPSALRPPRRLTRLRWLTHTRWSRGGPDGIAPPAGPPPAPSSHRSDRALTRWGTRGWTPRRRPADEQADTGRRAAPSRWATGPLLRRVRMRRILPLGVPIACGAAALLWRMVPPSHPESLGERFIEGSVLVTIGAGLVLGVRCELGHELGRVRAVAQAAQRVLLRPLPARLDGLMIAAAQLSATPGAAIGGDLYEAVATPYGVRIIIGDVRGHGLPAIDAVAVVLGSFREAAHDEPGLDGVLRRLDRSVQRHLGERARESSLGGEADAPAAEEFVTVLLLEIGTDGTLTALNCGHPWPYRLGQGVRQLSCGEPLPPLGMFPLPAELSPYRGERLLPGEALFLHTDGAAEARNVDGAFFALETFLIRMDLAGLLSPAAVIRSVHTELLRHTQGRITDDVALLVLRNDRPRVPAQYGEDPRRPRREPSSH